MQDEENNDHMAYWLSNTSTLLFLLQKSLKAAGASGATPNRKPPTATSLFGRMTMVLEIFIYLFIQLSLTSRPFAHEVDCLSHRFIIYQF